MKFHLPAAISQRAARTALLTQKHSPTILFGLGVVGVVATTVTACKATLKLEDVVSDMERDLTQAKTVAENLPDRYSERDRQQDTLVIYIRAAAKITKLYGPSLILGAASIACLTGSHNILQKRNAGLTMAYAAVDKAFKEYRSRVVDEYGEDKDREFRYGTETSTVVKEEVNGPKKSKVKHASTKGGASMYAKFFDPDNVNWNQQPEYNLMFLRAQQNWANDKLRAQGHLMLSDVYDSLGFDRTPASTQVGWLYNGDGDGYVDFGVFKDGNTQQVYEFATGMENTILLDFNVDGVMWDKIGRIR